YYFFHAEDGIRCFHVTGVQTCALPIYTTSPSASTWPSAPRNITVPASPASTGTFQPSAPRIVSARPPSVRSVSSTAAVPPAPPRSDERRVEEEARSETTTHQHTRTKQQ